MTSPSIWILIPLAFVPGLLVLQSRPRLVAVLGSILTGTLALLAWLLPIGKMINVLTWYFKVDPSLSVLGRTFTLTEGDRPVLVLIYLAAMFWFSGSRLAAAHRLFVPLGLGIVVCLVAALAVQPFLYAALLIEVAVLLSIPLLSPPGEPIGQGTLRYLIFQTLAMPFILFTGWMLSGIDANPGDSDLALRVQMLLGLGFAFLLAVFPFYTWIPLLTEKSHPYASGFILTMLQTVVLLFGLNFLDQYAWLRASAEVYDAFRLTGTIMIVTGGLWAAFQNHLGRILGYALIVETGFALLAVGGRSLAGLQEFSMLFLPRLLAIGIWALALSIIAHRVGSLALPAVQGLGRVFPLTAAALVLANLSVAGLPLLADFPVKQAILGDLAQQSSLMAVWVLLGSLGLIAAGLRTLASFTSQGGSGLANLPKPIIPDLVLAAGGLLLLMIGIFPQIFLPVLLNILKTFTQLTL